MTRATTCPRRSNMALKCWTKPLLVFAVLAPLYSTWEFLHNLSKMSPPNIGKWENGFGFNQSIELFSGPLLIMGLRALTSHKRNRFMYIHNACKRWKNHISFFQCLSRLYRLSPTSICVEKCLREERNIQRELLKEERTLLMRDFLQSLQVNLTL